MSRVHLRQLRAFPGKVAAELFPSVRQEMMEAVDAEQWRMDQPGAYCGRCGASAGPHAALPGGCAFCIDKPLAWRRLTRLSAYAPPMDQWIRQMKFHGRWAWASWCGQLLAESLRPRTQRHERVAVCPVPMHWIRRWMRGYNQSQLLVKALAKTCGWPVAPVLRRKRYTRPQTSVAPSQRAANVRSAFAIAPVDLSGWHIVLVDDVKTTGATLGACSRLLKRAGAASIEVAVLAVADPHGQNFTRIKP